MDDECSASDGDDGQHGDDSDGDPAIHATFKAIDPAR